MDASLIPTISFPAFATHEEVLSTETKANVVRKLRGQYGFKRFGRDGYKCALEDTTRRYYKEGETKVTCWQHLFFSIIFFIVWISNILKLIIGI